MWKREEHFSHMEKYSTEAFRGVVLTFSYLCIRVFDSRDNDRPKKLFCYNINIWEVITVWLYNMKKKSQLEFIDHKLKPKHIIVQKNFRQRT